MESVNGDILIWVSKTETFENALVWTAKIETFGIMPQHIIIADNKEGLSFVIGLSSLV